MVDGEIKCIGSNQHLKTKFGRGFTIEARPAAPDGVARVEESLQSHLDGRVLQSEGGQIRYQFVGKDHSLSSLFTLLESAQQQLALESYFAGQTTLEEIFLHVRAQA